MAIDTIRLQSPHMTREFMRSVEQKCILRTGIDMASGEMMYELHTGQLLGSWDARIAVVPKYDEWVTMMGKTVYVLAVSQNGMQITTVTSSELQDIGYKWTALTDCAVSLQWKDKVRALICDSPQITVGLQRTVTVGQGMAQ